MKIQLREMGTFFGYFIFFMVSAVCLSVLGIENSISDIRYYLLALLIFIGIIKVLIKNSKEKFDSKKRIADELLYIIGIALIFFIISVQRAMKNGYALSFRTIVQISLVLFPALYAYVLVNLLSTKTIIYLFEITFIGSICFYIYEVGIGEFLNINNWLSISYLHSYSPFENSTYADVFLYSFFFFNYFRHTDILEKRNLQIYSILSLIFVFLSFKRLQILTAVVIFVISSWINMRKKIKYRYVLGIALMFVIGTVIYQKFVSGQINILGIDPYYFTTGRSYILGLWKSKNYLSYGFGTSMLVIDRYLEMDLIQIYMELGIFALVIFSIVYFWIVRKNTYATILMVYSFGNMLTASSLPSSLAWVLTFVLVTIISSDKRENIGFEQKQYKINSRFFLKRVFCFKVRRENNE
ncbi:hypothetical protein KQI13_02180 [Anaerostipes hadrus]|nr:hypothetical protein [Anaerostipes hadrus]